MKLLHTIKALRRQRGISQDSIAERLCIARSSYSKLESGSTLMPYEKLVRIAAILSVSVYALIQEDGGLFVHSLHDKFSLLLHTAYYRMARPPFSAVPYAQLSFEQVGQLAAKGFVGQAAYESTPLRGRIYDYGPKKAFAQLMKDLGMQLLFEENLIRDPAWLSQWQQYQNDLNNHPLPPATDMDEQEYFIVFMILLTMPDGSTKDVQLAERDFPQGADAEGALQHLVQQNGAESGEILAYTEEGYAPGSEIVKCV